MYEIVVKCEFSNKEAVQLQSSCIAVETGIQNIVNLVGVAVGDARFGVSVGHLLGTLYDHQQFGRVVVLDENDANFFPFAGTDRPRIRVCISRGSTVMI